MAAQEIILTILALRHAVRLAQEAAAAFQLAAGVTDEQMAKAEADAKAGHNTLQETP